MTSKSLVLVGCVFLGIALRGPAGEMGTVRGAPLAGGTWSGVRDAGQQALHFLKGRLEIGLAVSRFSLDTTDAPGTDREIPGNTFLGNVTWIEEAQDSSPNLLINVMPIPYVGAQLTWGRVEARTWNWNTLLSDGTVEGSGPILSLLLRYPNATRFMPYAAIGKTHWDFTFNEDPYWRYGYSSPESYAQAGSPGRSRNGLQRIINVSGSDGTVLCFGLGIRILDCLSADFAYRTTEVETAAEYYRRLGGVSELRRTGGFPLEHSSYSGGLKYVF